MTSWTDAIDKLTSLGYRITLDGEKLRYAYQGKNNPSQNEITPLLEVLKSHKAQVLDYLRLLQTPQAKLEKPLLIESGYLNDTFFLVANEVQAGEIEREGKVCYLPGEIRALLTNSTGMDEEGLKDYLNKVHGIKKTFPGARVSNIVNLVN